MVRTLFVVQGKPVSVEAMPDGKSLQRWVTDAMPAFMTLLVDESAHVHLAAPTAEQREKGIMAPKVGGVCTLGDA